MSSAAPLAPLVETTEDRLRRELAQSSQAEARESLLREECARLRADNRALKRAEARRLAPPSAALYGPATRKDLEGPLLTGGELVVASKERPPGAYETCYELGIAIWLRNNGINGIEPAAMRRACFHVSTVEQLVNLSRCHMKAIQTTTFPTIATSARLSRRPSTCTVSDTRSTPMSFNGSRSTGAT